MSKKPKICMACCPGGHFAELRLATKDIDESKFDIYWLMFKSEHLKSFLASRRHHFVVNVIPDKKWTWVANALQSLWYLVKERPDCIISTGSGMAYPTIFFGKLFLKCKVIYVCSAADVTSPSRTPERAYKHSDLFCVQWPEMMKVFPNAKYIGVL